MKKSYAFLIPGMLILGNVAFAQTGRIDEKPLLKQEKNKLVAAPTPTVVKTTTSGSKLQSGSDMAKIHPIVKTKKNKTK